MGSSGGSSSGGDSTNTIRYASYIETRHQTFLADSAAYTNSAVANNPYDTFTDIPVDAGFFGTGYILASFPALFDVYGKFVAGLDIDALWEEILASTTNSPAAKNLVVAESALLDDELDSSVLPKFMTGMRDLNATMSSTFVNGKALLIDSKQKAIGKFSAELKWKLVGIAQDRYKAHIAWNIEVVNQYANLFNTYFSSKNNMTRLNYEFKAKGALWDLDVLDYHRANLGALQGAIKQTSNQSSSGSTATGVLGGALSGAAAGGMMTGGNPIGMVAGGIIGGVASLL